MIAFLQYGGKTLVLELSPLPGKPSYFDASVVTLSGAKAETPKPKTRKGSATELTRKRADELMIWLNKNPGTHALYSAATRALGHMSPGSIQAAAKEIARRKTARVNLKIRPHTISSLEKA